MSDLFTVNQRTQIGPETTHGTSVAAGKLLQNYDFTFAPNADIKMYRPSGHKYNTVQEENSEWMDVTVGGTLDYNSAIYPASGVYGTISPVAHGGSATAKDWVWTPPVSGSVDPKTFTMEWGDSVRARKLTYGLFTSFGYTLTRQDVSANGKMIGLALTDGITLTSSPTAVSLAPVVGKHWNVYLDTTAGAIGGTLLARVFSVTYLMDAVYAPFYALNRANSSFTGHADMAPAATLKMILMADAAGMAILGYMQTGATCYLRLQAQGAQIASDGPSTVFNTFQHDMAIKVAKPNPFNDQQGIYAGEWDFDVVEDSAWGSGQAQVITVTNLITAL